MEKVLISSLSQHEARARVLQHEVANWKKNNPGPLCLSYRNHQSNVTRKKKYKNRKDSISVAPFCNILEIDTKAKRALVEPFVTMEELAKKVFEYGLQVPVVPEFKGITVGGAINGSAGESSSFKYGLFNDICVSYQILLGNGDIVHASPSVNCDLFYGIAGSYGSLGTILQAEINLTDAPKAVKLTYHTFNDPKKAIGYIIERCQQKSAPEYLDGILFAKDLAVVMEGELSSHDEKVSDLVFPNYSSAWFYQRARDIAKSGYAHEEYFLPVDYFFRYDQGAFWMGSYLLQPRLLMRYFLEGLCKFRQKEALLPFSEKELAKFSRKLQEPTILQSIVNPLMTSQRLYSLLHKAENWVESKTIIQDFCIPLSRVDSFFASIQNDCGTWPLWICPVKKTNTPQLFSPHSTPIDDSHYVNFGIYGVANTSTFPSKITSTLEKEVHKHRGRKILYSHSYYSQDEFWNIYQKDAYEQLRQKYHADGAWLSIEQKVLPCN